MALVAAFQAAVRDRDLETLDRLLAPEFTLTTGRTGVPVRTRSEYLDVTARGYVVEEFAFEALDVVELGERAALVRSRYRQRGSMEGADRTGTFLLTDVWLERDGRPLLVARHSSALAEE